MRDPGEDHGISVGSAKGSSRSGFREEALNPTLVSGGGDQPRQGGLSLRHLEGGAEALGEGLEASRGEGLDPLLQPSNDGGLKGQISRYSRRRLGCSCHWLGIAHLPLLLVVERQAERIAKGHQRPFGGIGLGLLER